LWSDSLHTGNTFPPFWANFRPGNEMAELYFRLRIWQISESGTTISHSHFTMTIPLSRLVVKLFTCNRLTNNADNYSITLAVKQSSVRSDYRAPSRVGIWGCAKFLTAVSYSFSDYTMNSDCLAARTATTMTSPSYVIIDVND